MRSGSSKRVLGHTALSLRSILFLQKRSGLSLTSKRRLFRGYTPGTVVVPHIYIIYIKHMKTHEKTSNTRTGNYSAEATEMKGTIHLRLSQAEERGEQAPTRR